MASTGTTLGGVTLRDPDTPLEVYTVFVGQQTEAHDGALITDYTTGKLGWRLKWTLLTSAQRDLIRTAADTYAAQTFKPPHTATTYSVIVKQDTVVETVVHGEASNTWEFSFDIEEAA